MVSPASVPSRQVLNVLGDNTRYAIYLELARSPRPLVTAEIAETLGLHPNTVRPHLDRMREVGLVEVTTDARGEVGRPQHRYALAADAPSLGLEPPTIPVLARMAIEMAERLGASAADAVAIGRSEGRARALPYAKAPSALEALVADLDRLGFDPVVAEGDPVGTVAEGDPISTVAEGDPTGAVAGGEPAGTVAEDDADGTAVVAFANCPFAAYAASHPDLVCGLHHGLVAGFLEAMGDADIVEFCPLAHRTPCQVVLA